MIHEILSPRVGKGTIRVLFTMKHLLCDFTCLLRRVPVSSERYPEDKGRSKSDRWVPNCPRILILGLH